MLCKPKNVTLHQYARKQATRGWILILYLLAIPPLHEVGGRQAAAPAASTIPLSLLRTVHSSLAPAARAITYPSTASASTRLRSVAQTLHRRLIVGKSLHPLKTSGL